MVSDIPSVVSTHLFHSHPLHSLHNPNLRNQRWWLSYKRHQAQREEQDQDLQRQEEEPGQWWDGEKSAQTQSGWAYGQYLLMLSENTIAPVLEGTKTLTESGN